MPRIELGPHAPKARTLPLCYTPSEKINTTLLYLIFEPGGESFCLHPDVAKNMKIKRTDPKARTLPLCYTPRKVQETFLVC